jgi:hypothetical protein
MIRQMRTKTLVCAECGRHDPGDEPAAFCPESDEREFGGALKQQEPITGRSGEKSQWRKYPIALNQASSITTIAPTSGLDGKTDAGAARVSYSGSRDGLTASSVISYSSPSLSPKSLSRAVCQR